MSGVHAQVYDTPDVLLLYIVGILRRNAQSADDMFLLWRAMHRRFERACTALNISQKICSSCTRCMYVCDRKI